MSLYVCPECERTLSNAGNLRRHIRLMHNDNCNASAADNHHKVIVEGSSYCKDQQAIMRCLKQVQLNVIKLRRDVDFLQNGNPDNENSGQASESGDADESSEENTESDDELTLKEICLLSSAKRKSFFETCEKLYIDQICHLINQLLQGEIPMSPKLYSQLKKFKTPLRKLADRKTSVANKRRILQRATFLKWIASVA